MEVQLEDEVLRNPLVGCPSIEKVNIEDCPKLRNLRVGYRPTIQVDAINLQSFGYTGETICYFDLASCKKIKKLSLYYAYFYPNQDFESLISGVPLLESLTLWRCDPIGIRNHNLKVLVLRRWVAKIGGKYDLSIDAPNLVSFDYDGADNTLVNLFMNSTNLSETNLELNYDMNTFSMDWYISIIDFLSKFDCSTSTSLSVYISIISDCIFLK